LRYDGQTWEFKVKHFTKYGVDSDDDEDDAMANQSEEKPASPPKHAQPESPIQEATQAFDFKKSLASSKLFDGKETLNPKKANPSNFTPFFGNLNKPQDAEMLSDKDSNQKDSQAHSSKHMHFMPQLQEREVKVKQTLPFVPQPTF